jgi:copper chaperone
MIEFQVSGMHCGACVASVTRAVKAVDAGADVDADLTTQRVRVASSAETARIQAAIEAAGYDVLGSAAV